MATSGNNNNNSWINFQAPDGAQANTGSYPTIQWFNGGQGREHPVLKTGGWELPAKWFEAIIGDALPRFDIEHSGADSDDGVDPAYLMETLLFAAVMKHVSYYRGVGQDREWSPEYRTGFFSRVKLLGFVKQLEEIAPLTPVIVTFRSSVARDFNAVTKAFRADVLTTADKIAAEIAREAGQDAPDKFLPYAFWLPMGAVGKRVKTGSGQKSQYAPLEGKWGGSDFLRSGERDEVESALQALATPPDLREYVRDVFYDEAREWLETEKTKLAGHVESQEFTAPEGDE